MLAELALIPSIFRPDSYNNPEVCDLYLKHLKIIVLHSALVRDLYQCEWSTFISNNPNLHFRAQELFKKLKTQNRLRSVHAESPQIPTGDYGWCEEAIASHKTDPLTSIIGLKSEADVFSNEKIFSPINTIMDQDTILFNELAESKILKRTVDEYIKVLRRILTQANSLMFIDPHLDPSKPSYKRFGKLLEAIKRKECPPRIEIHRVCYIGSGRNKTIIKETEWKNRFDKHLSGSLKKAGLKAEVFIRDDFHYRYLITNIFGIGLENGFDESRKADDITNWNRLSRNVREAVQKEFAYNSVRRKCHSRFTIPI